MTTAAAGTPAAPPLGLVVMNLGGPTSLDDVEPFLQRLFGDPDVIQLGWLGFLQPLLARTIAKRRGPLSRAAYAQIGGRSPIGEETTAQAEAVAAELTRRGARRRAGGRDGRAGTRSPRRRSPTSRRATCDARWRCRSTRTSRAPRRARR